jgi:hypothetical protein
MRHLVEGLFCSRQWDGQSSGTSSMSVVVMEVGLS